MNNSKTRVKWTFRRFFCETVSDLKKSIVHFHRRLMYEDLPLLCQFWMARKVIVSKFKMDVFWVLRISSFVCSSDVCKPCLSSTEKLKSNEALYLETREWMRRLFVDFLRFLWRNTLQITTFNGLAKTNRKFIRSRPHNLAQRFAKNNSDIKRIHVTLINVIVNKHFMLQLS